MSGQSVITVVVRHGTHLAKFVHTPRQAGKVLADLDARNVSGNGPKLAAKFQRGFGFQIPGVLVRRPAPHEEENAGFGAPETGRLAPSDRRGTTFEQSGNGYSKQSQRARSHQLATRP